MKLCGLLGLAAFYAMGAANANQMLGNDVSIGPVSNPVDNGRPGCTGIVSTDNTARDVLVLLGTAGEASAYPPAVVVGAALQLGADFVRGDQKQNYANCALSCVELTPQEESNVSRIRAWFVTNEAATPAFEPEYVDYDYFCKYAGGRLHDGWWETEYPGPKTLKSGKIAECVLFKNWSSYQRTFHIIVDLEGGDVLGGKHVPAACPAPAPPPKTSKKRHH